MQDRTGTLGPELREALHWGLNELLIVTIRTMLEELGASRSMEVTKPHMLYAGRVMSRNFASRFGLEEGLEAIAFTPFCARCLTWGGAGRLALYEKGALVEFHGCPLSRAPPEACVMISHAVGEGACSEMDPGYEFLYTAHMTDGSPACVGVIRRKGSQGLGPEQLGREVRVVEALDIDDVEREALSFNIEVHVLDRFLESFLEACPGERVEGLLAPDFRIIGERAGGRAARMAAAVGAKIEPLWFLTAVGEMLGSSCRVDDGGRSTTMSGCVYGHSPCACNLVESFLAGMASVAFPEEPLRHEMGQEPQGCRLVIGPDPDEGRARDPMTALKMRFARGEITEEEFRRRKRVLLER